MSIVENGEGGSERRFAGDVHVDTPLSGMQSLLADMLNHHTDAMALEGSKYR